MGQASNNNKERQMKYFKVKIQGTTPFLQHRFGGAAEQEGTTRRMAGGTSDTPREAAEKNAYRRSVDGALYFPGAAIGRLLREAGGSHKLKGSRKSAKYVVPASILVLQDAITFHDAAGKTLNDFEVDSRPVVIPATKGRVMRHRPRLEEWFATFGIRINELLLEPKFVHQLLVEGGQQLGVGDFRPEKGGMFGTFQVVLWEADAKASAYAEDPKL